MASRNLWDKSEIKGSSGIRASAALLLICSIGFVYEAPASSATAADARPEQESAGDINEIVVTARRREETLQNVPVAITALTQAALEQKSIYNPFDLNKAVPGLNVLPDQASSNLPSFSVRGRGQSYGAASGSVETYFADVPLSPPFEAPTLPPQFFDLQSVQVLKGPQGTLFGRNSTGGAVLFVPAAPTDEFGGYARVQGGNYADVQFEGAVNLPLNDKVLLRLAVFEWHRDGYTRTLGGRVSPLGEFLPSQKINNQDVTEGRATLLLKPTDKLSNSTIFTYHTDRNRGSEQAQYYRGADLLPIPVAGSAADPRTFDTDVNLNRPASRTWAVINTTTFAINDELTLKNIASRIDARGYTANPSDYDGTGSGPLAGLEDGIRPPRPNHNYQTTDEIQLQGHAFDNKLEYLVGGLIDFTRQPGARDNINFFNLTYSVFNPPAAPFNESFNDSRFTSESAFSSLTWHLTDLWSLTAGARHTWDSITQTSANFLTPVVLFAIPDTVPLKVNAARFQGWTYNFGTEYHPSSDTLIYGGYRHGYKRGGFNTQVGAPDQLSFAPETDDDFYVGLKQGLNVFGLPGHFNIEPFYDIYHNAQREYLTFTPSGLTTIVANAEKSTYFGLDADFTLDATSWLSLSGAYTYVNSYWNKFTDKSVTDPAALATLADPSTSLSRNPISGVSRNKVTFTARLHANLSDGSEIAFAPSFNYQSRFYFDDYSRRQTNSSSLLFLGGAQLNEEAIGIDYAPGYSTMDLRAEWNKIRGSEFDLAINVNNITNKVYTLSGNTLYLFGVQATAYGPPRMATADIRYHF